MTPLWVSIVPAQFTLTSISKVPITPPVAEALVRFTAGEPVPIVSLSADPFFSESFTVKLLDT